MRFGEVIEQCNLPIINDVICLLISTGVLKLIIHTTKFLDSDNSTISRSHSAENLARICTELTVLTLYYFIHVHY